MPTRPRLMAVIASPRKPPVIPWSTRAANTNGKLGQTPIISAPAATIPAPSATAIRFDRIASSNAPPGSWLNNPANPPAVNTKPMLCWVHFCSARYAATYGPKPDNAPARNRLTPSRPRKLAKDGDGAIASATPAESAAMTISVRLRSTLLIATRSEDVAKKALGRRPRSPPARSGKSGATASGAKASFNAIGPRRISRR